jgi:hypothetical protein
VSGSSFGFDNRVSEDDPSADLNFEKWPTILADQLDLQLVNRSKQGASNLYIYDSLMESIIQNEGNVELVVASWTYSFKTSIFRDYELNFVNLDDQSQDVLLKELSTKLKDTIKTDKQIGKAIEQSLRLIVYLQKYCDSNNIKCIHYPLLNLFRTTLDKPEHIKVLEEICNSYFFQKIQQYKNILGWPSDTILGGHTYATRYPNLIISDIDRHPNAAGQKIIAQEVYDKYLRIIGN